MTTDKSLYEKAVRHDWTEIANHQWKRVGIDHQEAIRTCIRCGLETKMRRKMEFSGFGARYSVAYREQGGDWQKMYKPGQLEKRALPACITLGDDIEIYKKNKGQQKTNI